MKPNTINSIKRFIGIDVGKEIKGIVIKSDGTLLSKKVVEFRNKGGDALSSAVVDLINDLIQSIGGFKNDIKGIGVSCPGLIDSTRGFVVYSSNLGIKYYPIQKEISDKIGLPVKVTNNANAAALGETKFGAGKKYKNSLLITLGSGVGGGVVIDGKIFEGGKSFGTEIGHTVIEIDGKLCSCGRRGCLECYASETALIKQTRKTMRENINSEMWETYRPESVSVNTAFEYAEKDIFAQNIVDRYVKNLACGISNLVNIFRPQIIMLDKGASVVGEKLTVPLQKIVEKEIFAGTDFAPIKIVRASLHEKAGAFGAAALFM